ncbi:hypothetical protein PoB_000740000 [Plakobranchus ocellatus]|uniref:Uncharacterized protein n=1 Tax=Plakobranchus ocellatus TaxID=259542 RepID=A0AAV3YDV0_9GAST|nr:hypothetical protein PoB_000740000 [Plakobranchus ocellatus]
MVSSSLSFSSSMESSTTSVIVSDHSYSKYSPEVSGLCKTLPTAGITGILDCHSHHQDANLPNDIVNNSITSFSGSDVTDSRESDMLCDLDDLDFSISDFEMAANIDTKDNFLQDIIFPASSLPDRCLNSTSEISACQNLDYQHHSSSRMGLTSSSQFPSNCERGCAKTISSPSHVYGGTCETELSQQLNSTNSSIITEPSQFCTIPTKKCSRLSSAQDEPPLCLYTSCRKDSTHLSSSLVGSYQRDDKSGMELKPGDYLPPIYIDTQNYETSSPVSTVQNKETLCFPTAQIQSNDTGRNDTTSPASSTAANYNTVNPQSIKEINRPLVMPFTQGNKSSVPFQKPSQHQELSHLVDKSFAETSSDNNHEFIDELDLESISDLEKYITEAVHDLRNLESISPTESSPICHNVESSCFKNGESLSSVSGLRLSILHDFPERWDDEEPVLEFKKSEMDRKDNSNSSSVYNLHAQQPETCKTLSLLDESELHSTYKSLSTSTSSSESSTCPSTCNQSSHLSPGIEMEWNSNQDLTILDLFSDENAYRFLNPDSAICQMQMSQFM